MNKKILYFDDGGPENTDETIEISKERILELGIRDVVVASTHGHTGMKVAKALKGINCNIVVVTISEAFEKEGWVMSREERSMLLKEGVKVLTGIHALGDDVNSAFSEKYGGKSFSEIVTQTLYRFCQGMKVCVEIILMAADAGLIPMNKEILSIAGTGEGADTALIVKPAYARKFTDLVIREIIAKPR